MISRKIPLVAAHRGSAGGNIPCNSESAFKAALNQGADIIELDVSVSLDRKLFVFHPGKEFAYLKNPMFLGLVPSSQISKKRLLNAEFSVVIHQIYCVRMVLCKFWLSSKTFSPRLSFIGAVRDPANMCHTVKYYC